MKLLSLNELDPLCSLGAKLERAPKPTAADKRKAAAAKSCCSWTQTGGR